MYCINGKLLRVDLSTRNISVKEYDEQLAKKYFGGSGLAGYFFSSEFDNSVDPLSPDNPLFMMCGLLTATPVLTACKLSICARSPLTGIWGEATVGGFWGVDLKFAGYDGIIFTGRAEKPVYLWIDGTEVQLRDAGTIWGTNTFEADEHLLNATDRKARTLVIGRAGERMAKLASIMAEGPTARAAGRTGLGAVMGSKQLKAVVVKKKDKSGIKVANRTELLNSLKEIIPVVCENRKGSSEFGTNGAFNGSYDMGDLPIKNWRLSEWGDKLNNINGQAMVAQHFAKHYGCFACPIKCGKELKWDQGKYAGLISKGPEYETAAGFGSNLDIDDLKSVLLANTLCNDYGVDTLGTSAVLAVIMEAFEKKAVSAEQLGGIEPKWGDGDAMIELLTMLLEGVGPGKIWSDGSSVTAEWIGPSAKQWTMSVKGLDFACHDPRAFMSLGLSYATSNRGACHLEGMVHSVEWGTPIKEYGFEKVDRFSFERKGELTAIGQNFMATMNALGLCKFIYLGGGVPPTVAAQWTNDAMGWNLSLEEFMEVGERIYNQKRLFNTSLGIDRKDDCLPERILTLKQEHGSAAGRLPNLEKILPEYYEERGWDENGIPTLERIKKLGLKHLAEYRKSRIDA